MEIRPCDKTCPSYRENSQYCVRGPKLISRPGEGTNCFYNLQALQTKEITKIIKGPRGSEWLQTDCGDLVDLTADLPDSFKFG